MNLAAMVITLNEEANIGRTLQALDFVSHVLVIDSGSTDRTIDIVKSFSNTEIIHREFDTFADQCNFGLMRLSSEWILSLDADYIVPLKAKDRILKILHKNSESYDSYAFGFVYCIQGKPIRSALLPQRTCLYRRVKAHYLNIGHSHRVIVDGKSKRLRECLLHDDRKGMSCWLRNQIKYQMSEAVMLRSTSSTKLGIPDLVRKHTPFAPISSFLLCMLKGGIFEGIAGLLYAYERLVAESILYLYLHSDGEVKTSEGRHFKTLHTLLKS